MKQLTAALPVLALLLGASAARGPGGLEPANLAARWSFSEGRGTTAGDSSGPTNHATVANGATWTSGRLGKDVLLDGVNDPVALPADSSLVRNAPGATLPAWINPSSYPANGAFSEIFSISVNAGAPINTSRAALALKGDGTRADPFAGARSADTEARQGLTADVNLVSQTWTHVAAVFDFPGATVKIYVNGALAATAAGAFTAASSPETASTNGALGAQDKGDSNPFHGRFDDALVYNRALSDAGVQVLASADALAARWSLDDGAGPTAADSSGLPSKRPREWRDEAGRVIRRLDTRNRMLFYSYDEQGRVVEVACGRLWVHRFHHGNEGLLSESDCVGRRHDFAKPARIDLDRGTALEEHRHGGTGRVTRIEYDPAGRITQVIQN
jgi:YD repeat-containing protein